MPSLKDLKNRISSVKSTQKITKAKQLVAAAKLRRAQEAAEASKPYSRRLSAVVSNLATTTSGGEDAPRLLAGTGSDDVHLLVVMTAERGLCGAFNANIAKLAGRKVQSLEEQGKTVKIITVGKKGRQILNKSYSENFVDHVDLSEVKNNFTPSAIALGHELVVRFDAHEFDIATLIYSEFRNVMTQQPLEQQLMPVKTDEDAKQQENNNSVYEYEPSEEEILESLLPRYVTTQILSAMLENAAGEQAASMTAMDNATRNAGELIDKLTLQFNRARQAQITKELIEIISGAEAL